MNQEILSLYNEYCESFNSDVSYLQDLREKSFPPTNKSFLGVNSIIDSDDDFYIERSEKAKELIESFPFDVFYRLLLICFGTVRFELLNGVGLIVEDGGIVLYSMYDSYSKYEKLLNVLEVNKERDEYHNTIKTKLFEIFSENRIVEWRVFCNKTSSRVTSSPRESIIEGVDVKYVTYESEFKAKFPEYDYYSDVVECVKSLTENFNKMVGYAVIPTKFFANSYFLAKRTQEDILSIKFEEECVSKFLEENAPFHCLYGATEFDSIEDYFTESESISCLTGNHEINKIGYGSLKPNVDLSRIRWGTPVEIIYNSQNNVYEVLLKTRLHFFKYGSISKETYDKFIGEHEIRACKIQYVSQEDAAVEINVWFCNENYKNHDVINTEHLEFACDKCIIVLKSDERQYDDFRTANYHFNTSFMTAEWLYSALKKVPLVDDSCTYYDLSSVVNGYMKSVEQFLASIIINYVSVNSEFLAVANWGDDISSETVSSLSGVHNFQDYKVEKLRSNIVWKRNRRKSQVKTDLDAYNTFFIINNIARISRFSGDNATKISQLIWCVINDYKKYYRNEAFHTHNMYSWEEVDRIRRHTIIIYKLVLGFYYVPLHFFPEISDFDKLNIRLNKNYNSREFLYSVILKNNEKIKVIYDYKELPHFTFDKDGNITQNTIPFIRMRDFSERSLDEADYIHSFNEYFEKYIYKIYEITSGLVTVEQIGDDFYSWCEEERKTIIKKRGLEKTEQQRIINDYLSSIFQRLLRESDVDSWQSIDVILKEKIFYYITENTINEIKELRSESGEIVYAPDVIY